jgi:cyclophilin family peptidyl-prolyl cis-trans isomerase/HEAT repeat protein
MRLAVCLLCAASLACATSSITTAEQLAAQPLTVIARAEHERAAPGAFASALAAEDPAVRARAVLALARLEHAGTAPLLLRAMDDGDAGVRREAAFGLGQLDLALDRASTSHQAVRGQAEQRLVAALFKEGDASVRRAVVRALGRVSEGPGLDALLALATSKDALRAEAFTALGVSGARRKASRSGDGKLTSSVAAALLEGDDPARAGAAYAAFRQKLKLPLEALRAGVTSGQQARIFLLRAAPNQDDAGAQVLIDAGLNDADWRVQSEALRASVARPENAAAVSRVLTQAVARLASAGAADPTNGGAGHVIREACTALAAMGVGPAEGKPVLSEAIVALAPLEHHRAAACACAVALDVVEPAGRAIERCSTTDDDAALDVLKVRLASSARVPSAERVATLLKLYNNDLVKVRMAAAGALVEDGSKAAAEAAARMLDAEEDYGVATTLLELVSPRDGGDHADLLPDATMEKMSERFAGAVGGPYEKVEPLVTVAAIARTRKTPSAQAITEQLSSHSEPRVQDAAAGTLAGDRAPGARASVVAAPSDEALPLYAKLQTARGDIRMVFDRVHAPATVANFVALARAHFYQGTPFHRVIADFVAQGGDQRGDGAGGPGYTIACENSDEEFTRGAVGMATAGKDTGGSQFFLTHSHQPHLDGRYTLFARVVDGLEVMDAIQPDDVLIGVDFLSAVPVR